VKRVFHNEKVGIQFQEKLSHWVSQQTIGFCFKGNGWGKHINHKFEVFAGCGVYAKSSTSLDETEAFIEDANDYVITALSYDLKNNLESLTSENPDQINFPESLVFIPSITIKLDGNIAVIGYRGEESRVFSVQKIISEIEQIDLDKATVRNDRMVIKSVMHKHEYLNKIHQCKRHLKLGNIYQANICQEFYWNSAAIEPAALFEKGFVQNPNPFSVYLKYDQVHCMSWSPERFISKKGNEIVSQPMKGTAPRNSNSKVDNANKRALQQSEKERRENVMIVDMVRNDLSLYAAKGSVNVSELYKVKTYPRVHQMYSTVTAKLKQNTSILSAILNAFPMGSMTGAPKRSAMQIIDNLESSKRGLYSGSIGFITPEKNADFNVIIRTLLYNATTNYLSCQVGGGITDMSDPEAEYDECLLKLQPMLDLVESLNC
jgi:para-aminobenzoate synthetase component 1